MLDILLDIFYNFYGLNASIFLFINNITNINILPTILKLFSLAFGIVNFVFYYFLCVIYFYNKLKYYKNTELREKHFYQIYLKLIKSGIIYTIFGFIYSFLKFSFNVARPFCSLPENSFKTIANIGHERCLSSFPSSHVGLAILISYILWEYLGIIQKAIAISVIILVAISRITLAMHYPADILWSVPIIFSVIKIGNILFDKLYEPIIKPIGRLIYYKIFVGQ